MKRDKGYISVHDFCALLLLMVIGIHQLLLRLDHLSRPTPPELRQYAVMQRSGTWFVVSSIGQVAFTWVETELGYYYLNAYDDTYNSNTQIMHLSGSPTPLPVIIASQSYLLP